MNCMIELDSRKNLVSLPASFHHKKTKPTIPDLSQSADNKSAVQTGLQIFVTVR